MEEKVPLPEVKKSGKFSSKQRRRMAKRRSMSFENVNLNENILHDAALTESSTPSEAPDAKVLPVSNSSPWMIEPVIESIEIVTDAPGNDVQIIAKEDALLLEISDLIAKKKHDVEISPSSVEGTEESHFNRSSEGIEIDDESSAVESHDLGEASAASETTTLEGAKVENVVIDIVTQENVGAVEPLAINDSNQRGKQTLEIEKQKSTEAEGAMDLTTHISTLDLTVSIDAKTELSAETSLSKEESPTSVIVKSLESPKIKHNRKLSSKQRRRLQKKRAMSMEGEVSLPQDAEVGSKSMSSIDFDKNFSRVIAAAGGM